MLLNIKNKIIMQTVLKKRREECQICICIYISVKQQPMNSLQDGMTTQVREKQILTGVLQPKEYLYFTVGYFTSLNSKQCELDHPIAKTIRIYISSCRQALKLNPNVKSVHFEEVTCLLQACDWSIGVDSLRNTDGITTNKCT